MFEFKTEPYAHQREEWLLSREMPSRGILWEQGTGKTKPTIDTAAWLYSLGKIDTLVVVAPNMVHANWITDECPIHMGCDWKGAAFHSPKAGTKKHQAEIQGVFDVTGSLAVIAFSYNGIMTDKGAKAFKKFLEKRTCMLVYDESQRIKNPDTKRTKRCIAAARRAPYKRILSGTPIVQKPFDIYAQVRAIEEHYWKDRGMGSSMSFKNHFGVFKEIVLKEADPRVNQRREAFKQCVGFKNLEELADHLAAISSRVVKSDVLDLPPKLYKKIYVELSPEQKRLYRELSEELFFLLDTGEIVTAELMLTRLMRFQQILSGFITTDDGDIVELEKNPRLTALFDVLEDIEEGKVIIFGRFKSDVTKITEKLNHGQEHPVAVAYDGSTTVDARLRAKDEFQDPESPVRYFIGNPAACATGLTLTQARTVIYYSQSFDLEHRLQSEDRAHRIGQEHSVLYIDFAARGTVDTKIVQSLREKRSLAEVVQRDNPREWI